MQCRDVEQVLEQEGLGPLPEAARAHLTECAHCQEFIADLEMIISAARELPAEVEPPPRVWVSLRNQLEQEGVIWSETTPVKEHFSWGHGFAQVFRRRALAALAVGALISVAAIVQLRQPTPAPLSLPPGIEDTVKLLDQQEVDVRNMHLASSSPVDASLQQNLQQIDDFIADCKRHLKDVPQDEVAREYLYSAYEQKAELLSAMLDRGRSVN